MATITPTLNGYVPAPGQTSFPGESFIAQWSGITDADTVTPLEMGAFADRSVQVTGVGSPAATVAIQGSNDGTNYVTLYDLQGSALSFTAAGLKGIAEATRYIKPVVTGGTGESVVVTIFARM